MFLTVIALKYALLVSRWSYGHFLKLTDFNNTINLRHLTQNIMSCYAHTHCASAHKAAKLVAALLRVAGVTAGLAESNCSLPPGL